MIPGIDYIRILPEIVLALFGMIVMVADPLLPEYDNRKSMGFVSALGCICALCATFYQAAFPGTAFFNMVRVDAFSVFFHIVIIVVALITTLSSFDYAVAPRAGWSDIGKCPGVATAAPVDGRTACTPCHTPDTANRSRHGVPSERGSLPPPASVPPSPRTREPRFRECADTVHGLASPKLSHAALEDGCRSTINPEFPLCFFRQSTQTGVLGQNRLHLRLMVEEGG